MSQYKIGTVSVTNGSAVISGVATSWLSNLSINDEIQIKDPDLLPTELVYYTVGGINSDTQITLTAPYGSATKSGLSYVAHRDFIGPGIAKFANGDVETPGLMNKIAQAIANIKAVVTNPLNAASKLTSDFPLKIDSLSDLPATATAGQRVSVTSYHTGTTIGGGEFAWSTGVHNGGTFIDPTRSSEIGTSAYYVDSGVVYGWARVCGATVAATDFGCGAVNSGIANAKALKNMYIWLSSSDNRIINNDIDYSVELTDADTVLIQDGASDYTLHIINSVSGCKVIGTGIVSFSKNTTRRMWTLVFKNCASVVDEMNIDWGFVPTSSTVTTSSQHGTMLFNCTASATKNSRKIKMDGAPFSNTGQPLSPAIQLNTGYSNKCIFNEFEYFEQCSTFGAGAFGFQFAFNLCRNNWLSGIKISTNPASVLGFMDSVGNYDIHNNQFFWTPDFQIPLQVNGINPTFPHAVMFESSGRVAKFEGNLVDMSQISLSQSNSSISCIYVLGNTDNSLDEILQDLAIKGNTLIPTPHHSDGNLAKISPLVNNLDWSENTELSGWISIKTSNPLTLRRGNYNFDVKAKSPVGSQFTSTTTNFFIDKILAEHLTIAGDLNGGDVIFGGDIDVNAPYLKNLINSKIVKMNSGLDAINAQKFVVTGCECESYQLRFASLDQMNVTSSLATTDVNGFDIETGNANCTISIDAHVRGLTGESASRALKLDQGLLRVDAFAMSANANIAFELGVGVVVKSGNFYGVGAPTQAAWPGVRYTNLAAAGVDKHWIKTDFTGALGWRQIAFAP